MLVLPLLTCCCCCCRHTVQHCEYLTYPALKEKPLQLRQLQSYAALYVAVAAAAAAAAFAAAPHPARCIELPLQALQLYVAHAAACGNAASVHPRMRKLRQRCNYLAQTAAAQAIVMLTPNAVAATNMLLLQTPPPPSIVKNSRCNAPGRAAWAARAAQG
jgi:hypothetical protein